jgi:hypothetical protein
MASIAFTPQLSADATAALSGGLKGTSAAGRAAKAKANGEDFEAMFLNSMFQQMFEGVGKGKFSGGPGATIWRSASPRRSSARCSPNRKSDEQPPSKA